MHICDETNVAGVRHLIDAELEGVAGGQDLPLFAELIAFLGGGTCSKDTPFTDQRYLGPIGTCDR